MDADRMLVDPFYAQPVGHAVEALHDAQGHAAPELVTGTLPGSIDSVHLEHR